MTMELDITFRDNKSQYFMLNLSFPHVYTHKTEINYHFWQLRRNMHTLLQQWQTMCDIFGGMVEEKQRLMSVSGLELLLW